MSLDTQVFLFVNHLVGIQPAIDWFILFFATYVPFLLIAFFLVLVIRSSHTRIQKLEFLTVTFFSTLIARFGITELIRFFYHRPRPYTVLPVEHLTSDSAWSFPSGHATFFFALATAIYLYNKKWGRVFLMLSGVVAVARVVAGVHYPLDVLAGAAIGTATAYGTFHVVRYVISKKR